LPGLVKHLAGAEHGWFCWTFGRPTEPLRDPADGADLRAEPDEPAAGIVAFYGRARKDADRVISELGMEETGTAWSGQTASMR